MAKVYSSVDDKLLKDIEIDTRQFFISGVGNDVSKIKLLVKHINLYKRLGSIEDKLRALTLDREEELKLLVIKADCTAKGQDVSLNTSYAYVHSIIKFVYFVNTYGFRRLTNLLTFTFGLKSKEGEFDYYECRY